jgi:hypothetical protein
MSHDGGIRRTDNEWFELVDSAPSLSTASRLSYKKQLRSAIRVFHVQGPTALSSILEAPEKVEDVMKHVGDNSLRSYLAAIVSLFKRGEEGGFFKRSDPRIGELYSKWAELLQNSSKRYLGRIDENKESDRERETRTTLGDWHVALDVAMRKDPDSQATLLLAFHALVMPPLRGGDLAHVHVGYTDIGNCAYRDPDNDNQTILLIRDHKTSRSFGPLKRVLKGEMVTLLRKNVNANPRPYIFMTQGGAPYSDSGFSSWKSLVFREAFGRPVTTNSLRHGFISGMDRQHQSIREARDIARDMGHGLHTQRQYVRIGGDRG